MGRHFLLFIWILAGLVFIQSCESLTGLRPGTPRTPCDNYGELDPTMHFFHKILFEKCSQWCKLQDRLSKSIPLS